MVKKGVSMSGYNGFSMSNNAVLAYENGLKPYSKWTKCDILDCLSVDSCTVKKLRKYSVQTLKDYFLQYTEWHHTSNYFNCTDFYSVKECDLIDFVELDSLESWNKEKRIQQKERKQAAKALKKAFCSWYDFEGTRKHKKKVYKYGYCVLSGTFAYTQFDTKKKIEGKYFKVKEVYEKAPKGTAAIFKGIEKSFDLLKK